MCLEAFIDNGYDDVKHLTEMFDEELQEAADDVQMTNGKVTFSGRSHKKRNKQSASTNRKGIWLCSYLA